MWIWGYDMGFQSDFGLGSDVSLGFGVGLGCIRWILRSDVCFGV